MTVPIYGKLSDSFGRKPILLAGVSLFLLGSLLCGLAPGTMSLVAFRAVQGLGAGSLFTTAFAVIADIFPPAERGKYMGLIGAVMAVASVVGPLAGGLITDQFGWHSVFFINLPVGAIAVWFIAARMPRLGAPATAARSRVDVPGAAALVVGVVPLLIALGLGRAESAANRVGLAWGSWPMLAMLTLSALGLAAFYVIERRAADPIIDLRLFRRRVIGLGTAATFVLGAAFLFSVVFLPLFLVNVVGVSATRAGLTMMPLTMGIVAGSVLTGQIVARFGHSRRLMLGSLVLLGIGFAVMAFTLTPDSTQTDVTLRMILVGLGIGPQFPVYTLVIQHAAPPEDIGVVTAATTFSRSLGQVVGVAAFGTIFASVFAASVERRVSAIVSELPTHVRELVSPTIAPTAGASEQMSVTYDTAHAKAQLGELLAGRSGSNVEVRPGPIDEGRATDDSSVDRRAALGAVDEIARAHEWAFSDAISTMYRGALGLIALAFLLSIPIPDAPLHGVRAPRQSVEIGRRLDRFTTVRERPSEIGVGAQAAKGVGARQRDAGDGATARILRHACRRPLCRGDRDRCVRCDRRGRRGARTAAVDAGRSAGGLGEGEPGARQRGADQLGVRTAAAADHRQSRPGRRAKRWHRLRPSDRARRAHRDRAARRARRRGDRRRRRARARRHHPLGSRVAARGSAGCARSRHDSRRATRERRRSGTREQSAARGAGLAR